ncbi:MAG: hypothetical protein WCT28_03240 [Patescibacteria group bacterium]|jgi:hypothetical protein
MFRRFVGLFFAFTIASPAAFAESPKTSVCFTQGVTFPIGFEEPFGGAPSISEGVRVIRGWWMVEGGFGASFSAFTPSGYVSTGPAQPLSENVLLGEGVALKFTPSYGGAPASTALSAAVTPMFITTFGTVGTGFGIGCTVTSKPVVCGASVGVKLAMKIK